MNIFTKIKSSITNHPMPFGLRSPYGTVWGWTLHEQRYFPEQETIEFFKKHLTKDDVVADIGANIGLYTLFFSEHVKKICSFEPSPDAYKKLLRAVKGRSNVHTYNVGIFSKRDTLRLYHARPGDPMGSVMYQRSTVFTEVPVQPLTDINETFTWAKIDVEGAELEVLKGMRPTKAVLEVARSILTEHQGGVEHFLSTIESMGYKVFFITHGGNTVSWNGKNLESLVNNIYIEPRNSHV